MNTQKAVAIARITAGVVLIGASLYAHKQQKKLDKEMTKAYAKINEPKPHLDVVKSYVIK